ncbi:MAG: hypothetical protein EAY75_13565 [Bacteroidetes bacterium]|nr:MAG: hypothetical protein EAY75_13565 [Bacteroidota bacterium]
MVGSLLPSSKPVKSLLSVFLSNTCTLFTISACRFRLASLGSLVKNSLPSTSMRFTSCPLVLMVPSALTSTPGSFFSKSSTTALGLFTLNELALYSMVSPFITMGAAVTTTSARVAVLVRARLPKSFKGWAALMVNGSCSLPKPV